jgi:hypothetical protein
MGVCSAATEKRQNIECFILAPAEFVPRAGPSRFGLHGDRYHHIHGCCKDFPDCVFLWIAITVRLYVLAKEPSHVPVRAFNAGSVVSVSCLERRSASRRGKNSREKYTVESNGEARIQV